MKIFRRLSLVFLLWAGSAAAVDTGFPDVNPDGYAAPYIKAIKDAGITTGCGNGNYCPGSNVDRQQMAAFIVRAVEGEPGPCTSAPFGDVPVGHPFCKYIQRLKALNITTGCGGGNYCPAQPVTRDQMAAFLVRALEGDPAGGYCGATSPFTDVPLASTFCGHIKRLLELAVTTGCGGGNYCPTQVVNREQMAVFLGRAFLGMSGSPLRTLTVQSTEATNVAVAAEKLQHGGSTNYTRQVIDSIKVVLEAPLSVTGGSGTAHFQSWTGCDVQVANRCTLTMSADRTVTAAYGASAAFGSVYFVSPTGSDSAAGTSPAAPFRTIGRAIESVGPGDIINVRAGSYNEALHPRTPGASNAWITLRNHFGERPVIRGVDAGPAVYFYRDECDEQTIGNQTGNVDCMPMYWTLQGLEIRGSATGGGDGNVVKIDTPRVRLIGNRLCCSAADIVKLVRTANDVELRGNEIWQNSQITPPSNNAQGVDIVGADRTLVIGNYVHDLPDIGIYAKGNARNAVFDGNLLINIGRADNGNALMLGQSTDFDRMMDGSYESYDGVMRNNVVINSTWACLATASSQHVKIYNNSCFNTGQLAHGTVLLSNEAETGQAGAEIEIINNAFYGAASHPIIRATSNAMDDYATLRIDKNIYWIGGTDPRFEFSDRFASIGTTVWKEQYKLMTGVDDTSLVVDPGFVGFGGLAPLAPVAGSAAIDAGLAAPTVVSADRLGVARPQGGATDIGAYESTAVSQPFSFLAYGDSRAGGGCDGNAVHISLVARMAIESAALAFHLGDMITGYDATSNWVQRGSCPADAANGSFKQVVAPLMNKTPAPGLPMYLFPVLGNHDDGWGDGWYPDPSGDGFCSVFNPVLLVPNHTQRNYFLDKTGRVPRYTDSQFYSLACSTQDSSVYPNYLYYSFDFRNTHFVVMRVDSEYYNLEECYSNCGDPANYDSFYYKHQLDWLKADLATAAANPSMKHVVVFVHAPLFTSSWGHAASSSWRTLTRLFSDNGKVRLVFSGHNHVYERSVPISVSADHPDGVRDDAQGIVYVTTGGGGSDLHGFSATDPLMARQEAVHHYVRVDVGGDTLAVRAMRADGTTLDSFAR